MPACALQNPVVTEPKKLVIAFGPELPGVGSWEWIGGDMAQELSGRFQTLTFKKTIPRCDLLVLLKDKYFIPQEEILSAAQKVPVIFCPVDLYGSSAEIDRDWRLLRNCSRVILHADVLRKYFQSYAVVDYLDHHLKYIAPLRKDYPTEGPILWTGMRTNLPPLAEWVNRHPLPAELWILTNLNASEQTVSPQQFGFRANEKIRIESWNPEKHREWAGLAKAAIDIKGTDFRQRHKPPTKAMDCIASGLPLAMNPECNSVTHLASLGFEVVSPHDVLHWFSREYWDETQQFARRLRASLSRKQVGERFQQIINDVLVERSNR